MKGLIKADMNDIYKSFRFIMFLCIILGGVPLKFNLKTGYVSKSCIFTLLSVACLAISLYQVKTYVENIFRGEKDGIIYHTFYFQLIIIMDSIQGITTRMILLLKLSPNLQQILRQLKTVDSTIQMHYPKSFWRDHHFASVLIFFDFILICCFNLEYIFVAGHVAFNHKTFFLNISHIGNGFAELQIYSLCYYIYKRYKVINDILAILEEQLSGKDNQLSKKEFVGDFNEILGLYKVNNVIMYYDKVNNKIGSLNSLINRLRMCQRALQEATNLINKIYGIIFLVGTIVYGSNSILGLFFSGFTNEEKEWRWYNSYIATWMLKSPIRFICFCLVPGKTSNEANETKGYLTNILQTKLDAQCKEEINFMLKSDLCHPIRFSALGFYNLNYELLASSISLGITYLVILYQNSNANY